MNLFISALNVRSERDKDAEEYHRRYLLTAFIRDLDNLPKDVPVVFLFDGFDQAGTAIKSWLNEQLLLGIYRLSNVFVVFAGRELPEVLTTCEDICEFYELFPVSLEDHKIYCRQIGINASDDVIAALHKVFDGKPGFFAEFAAKLSDGDFHAN